MFFIFKLFVGCWISFRITIRWLVACWFTVTLHVLQWKCILCTFSSKQLPSEYVTTTLRVRVVFFVIVYQLTLILEVLPLENRKILVKNSINLPLMLSSCVLELLTSWASDLLWKNNHYKVRAHLLSSVLRVRGNNVSPPQWDDEEETFVYKCTISELY